MPEPTQQAPPQENVETPGAPDPNDGTGPSVRRCRWRRTWRVAAIGVACLLLLGLAAISALGWLGMINEDRFAKRDPKTGVIVGLEARDLGPRAQDGATTAVLMIHGFVASRLDFADLGDRLTARGLHVREMLLPGHGTTPRDFSRKSPEDLNAAVLAEFRALKAKYREVDVIGFSMGGSLATILAKEVGTGPGGVGRLGLAAPYYGITYNWHYVLPPETWNSILRWVIPAVPKNDHFLMVNRKDDRGKWFTYHNIPTQCITTLIAIGKQARAPETLAAIRCPVLMVMSVGDGAASPARARAALAGMPSADKKALWLTRSNHILFWDYEREEAKAAFVEFFGRRPAPPGKQP